MDTPSKSQWPPIIGARDICRYLYGDDGKEGAIYEAGLPLFKVGGRVAAFREDLDRAVLAREQMELVAIEERQKVLREKITAKTAREHLALEICERRQRVLAEKIAAKAQGEVVEGLK
ncbi:MAG: hypothetical protein WCC90_20150 [Methylocella sp.]